MWLVLQQKLHKKLCLLKALKPYVLFYDPEFTYLLKFMSTCKPFKAKDT